jgi:uncharacterized protein DUF4058
MSTIKESGTRAMSEPIVSLKNLYTGINPHLQSLLQTPGRPGYVSKWPGFHSLHIAYIVDSLNQQLPPQYTAVMEQSLQIRAEDVGASPKTKLPEPDVTIYGMGNPGASVASPVETVWSLALEDTLDMTEDYVKGVVIRQSQEDDDYGKPVTRIELLSPSNKPEHVGYDAYRRGRIDALFSGLPLIELDYLHETPPPVMNYPLYPQNRKAFAYKIFVSDPRPDRERRAIAFGFGVGSPFPLINIPLGGEDILSFDFGAVYQHTYFAGRWGRIMNYARPPVRLETYSHADQERIRERMAEIAEMWARGEITDGY